MKRDTVVYGLIFVLLAVFASCDDKDDKYSLDKYYQSIVVIEGDVSGGGSDGAYWLKLGNGNLLWPVNQNWLPVYGGEIGTRGFATYNLVGGPSNQFSNLIRLIGISGITTKNILTWNKENADTIVLKNWNPGVIQEAWLEKSDSTYLNVIFEYRAKKNIVHYINLVQDQLNDPSENPVNGVWNLKFCQNSNGDRPDQGNRYRMLISFFVPNNIDLSSLKKINIRYVDWNSSDLNKVYEINVGSTVSPAFGFGKLDDVYEENLCFE